MGGHSNGKCLLHCSLKLVKTMHGLWPLNDLRVDALEEITLLQKGPKFIPVRAATNDVFNIPYKYSLLTCNQQIIKVGEI